MNMLVTLFMFRHLVTLSVLLKKEVVIKEVDAASNHPLCSRVPVQHIIFSNAAGLTSDLPEKW